MRWFLVVALLFLALLMACGPQVVTEHYYQEPIIRWTTLPLSGNPVAFGASLYDINSQTIALADIDQVVNRRIPGVRFYIVKYPVVVGASRVTSYRAPTQALIVLSHRFKDGVWSVQDISWEVEHLIAGTDDAGNPWIPLPH